MRQTGTPQPIHAIHHLAEHQQHDAISHAVASDHPCEIQSRFTSDLIRISNDLSREQRHDDTENHANNGTRSYMSLQATMCWHPYILKARFAYAVCDCWGFAHSFEISQYSVADQTINGMITSSSRSHLERSALCQVCHVRYHPDFRWNRTRSRDLP